MPNNPIPVPRKTTLSDVIVWFFSGWRECLTLLFLIAMCIATACLIWAMEWQRANGKYPTWQEFISVVSMVLGGAP